MLKPIIGCLISLEEWHGMLSVMQMGRGAQNCRLSLYAYVLCDGDRQLLTLILTNTDPSGTALQTLSLPFRKHHSPSFTRNTVS
jgi:hypothetical protein